MQSVGGPATRSRRMQSTYLVSCVQEPPSCIPHGNERSVNEGAIFQPSRALCTVREVNVIHCKCDRNACWLPLVKLDPGWEGNRV